jgi:hypothetical protein
MTIAQIFGKAWYRAGPFAFVVCILLIAAIGFVIGRCDTPPKVVINTVIEKTTNAASVDILTAMQNVPNLEGWELGFATYRDNLFNMTIYTKDQSFTFRNRHLQDLFADIDKVKMVAK